MKDYIYTIIHNDNVTLKSSYTLHISSSMCCTLVATQGTNWLTTQLVDQVKLILD